MNVLHELKDDEFLEFCYRYFLRRVPDPQGREYWLSVLSGGGLRLDIIRYFASCPESLAFMERRVHNARKSASDALALQWAGYEFGDVVDAGIATSSVRNYIEHATLREYLCRISGGNRLAAACEIGCGYGRMTQVIPEYATQVKGFEREPTFVQRAAELIPHIAFAEVSDPGALPASSGEFDFVLTFTFLQHLTDQTAQRTVQEIKRILKPDGYILSCEETDTNLRQGDVDDPSGLCTIGRSVEQYELLFRPLILVESRARQMEPGYPRSDSGSYMLFTSSPASEDQTA